jgi:DNA repair protein RecO (recombination protein O)
MQHNGITGIILSRTLYKDSDVILNVLTDEEGKVSMLAKGVRKIQSKLKGLLCIGSIHRIDTIKSKGALVIVRGARYVFSPEVYDYEELKVFEKALQLTSHFCQKNQSVQEVFCLLREFIILFEKSKKKDLLSLSYALRTLTGLGFLGDLRYCIQCQEKLELKSHFFNKKQGFICFNCLGGTQFSQVSLAMVKLLAFIQRSSFGDVEQLAVSEKDMEQLWLMVNDIIRYQKEC